MRRRTQEREDGDWRSVPLRFSAAGAFAGRADGGLDGWPRGGANNPVTGDNVVTNGAFAVGRFGSDGTLLGGWPMPGVVEGAANSGFGGAIATAADGTIWAAHSPTPQDGNVVAYSPTGVALRRIADSHIDNPIGLATGPGGELYVVEGGGVNPTAVDVFGPDERSAAGWTRSAVPTPTVDDAGRIYAGLRNKIAIFDRSGALLARFGEPGSAPGQFDGTQLSLLDNVLTITGKTTTASHACGSIPPRSARPSRSPAAASSSRRRRSPSAAHACKSRSAAAARSPPPATELSRCCATASNPAGARRPKTCWRARPSAWEARRSSR